jgi:hypothetical protein
LDASPLALASLPGLDRRVCCTAAWHIAAFWCNRFYVIKLQAFDGGSRSGYDEAKSEDV